jgi:hypothetical protein
MAFLRMIQLMLRRAGLELLPSPNTSDFLDKVWRLA